MFTPMHVKTSRDPRLSSSLAFVKLAKSAVLFVLPCLLLTKGAAQVANGSLQVHTDHPTGVYATGERIRWNVDPLILKAFSQGSYTLKKNGLTAILEGQLTLKGGEEIDSNLEEPGTLLLEIQAVDPESRTSRHFGGAVAAPEKIQPSMPRPEDFDSFWDAKVQE